MVISIFQIDRVGPALVVIPQRNFTSLADEALQQDLVRLLSMAQDEQTQHVLFDFSCISFFGSSMLEAMRRLYNVVVAKKGTLAVCGLSDVGRDVLHVTRFDTLWKVFTTRDEALQALGVDGAAESGKT